MLAHALVPSAEPLLRLQVSSRVVHALFLQNKNENASSVDSEGSFRRRSLLLLT